MLVYKDIIRKALLDSSSDENDDIDISLGDGISARRNACAENLRLHVVLKFLKQESLTRAKECIQRGVVGSRNELDSRNRTRRICDVSISRYKLCMTIILGIPLRNRVSMRKKLSRIRAKNYSETMLLICSKTTLI